MADEIEDTLLHAELRSDFGKGFARRIRRSNKVPAVLYNGKETPIHITLPGHETMLALRQANVLLDIVIDENGQAHLALPKQVQRHPVTGEIQHVDLIIVHRGERVTVEIPVILKGEPADASLVVTQELASLKVQAEATHIPTEVEVSVEGLNIGDHIAASQVNLPKGAVLEEDPEALIVVISAPDAAPAAEADEASETEAAE